MKLQFQKDLMLQEYVAQRDDFRGDVAAKSPDGQLIAYGRHTRGYVKKNPRSCAVEIIDRHSLNPVARIPKTKYPVKDLALHPSEPVVVIATAVDGGVW